MREIAEIAYKPIGIIRTTFQDHGDTPIQSILSDAEGTVEVFPEYVEGLRDVDGFSHVFLIYHFHRSGACSLVERPFLDTSRARGIFAIRHFNRPNPIGLSIVELKKVRGNVLDVRGVDVLDGTPLLDIKPYIKKFDCRENARSGWVDEQDIGSRNIYGYTPHALGGK